MRLASLCREAALEGCKAELVAVQQQLVSHSQRLEALNGSFTKQTAELHNAQSLVAQLQNQVHCTALYCMTASFRLAF